MLDRVRSSRSIARNVRENIVYMYLAEKLQPDFLQEQGIYLYYNEEYDG